MLKVVLNDLFINVKKNIFLIILDMFLSSFIGGFIASIIIVADFSSITYNENLIKKIVIVFSLISIIFLYSIMRRIPLRLNKAMFVCAAGEFEKIKYILLQLGIKIIFSFLTLFILMYFSVGRFFISNNLIINIIQIILWFFIILNINLKVGIGERGKKEKDKDGYVIITKEEEIVNVYWFCLLIIEAIAFYSLVSLNINFNLFVILGWIIAFAINTFVLYRYLRPILNKSLSYEAVYCQVPERNEYY
ncbi:hypothetical protein [uncultured Clostridium sp.]|uniref:hypothetical protein n=1 Tax=uncultured Clostridium sp. TaxID=59620 RepID=UPI0025DC574C|nr:hypothetical protein [uncultured Clostridium sp.]MDU4884944.1 hypothetical protein [Clostridium celatum]MDU7075660.1 hypothetical protein [Clostridium celatum]